MSSEGLHFFGRLRIPFSSVDSSDLHQTVGVPALLKLARQDGDRSGRLALEHHTAEHR